MKQYYLIAVLSITCLMSYAQDQTAIVFEYDAAGNRTVRKLGPPLPVTLVSFKAEKRTDNMQQPSTLLRWRTTSETNSDHFDIQRSGDGKKWFDIGVVQASGDKASDTDYSFIDQTPTDGENIYRLKMVDRDGTFAYSSLQGLNFGSLTVFYPNPIKTRLLIKGLVGSEAKISKVQVWDASGKLVRESTGVPAEGIDMSQLPTGIYTVSIARHNGLATVRKVVKE
jgi:hypothetical protein